MQAIVMTTALSLAVLAICFAGPVIALTFLLRRKKVARDRRRSPLTADLLRAPGQSIREDLMKAEADLIWDLTLLVVIPALALALIFAQALFRAQLGVSPPMLIYGVALAGALAFLIRKLIRAAAEIDQLRLGYDGELAVGQELDRLMREGAFVFHDVPGEKTFNIDHVVVSTSGVFAVETKGYSKPNLPGTDAATVDFDGSTLKFPHFISSTPLTQAARQAKWLSRELSAATASNVDAIPVLALPGWFVRMKARGPVRVFASGQLNYLLRSGVRDSLSDEDVKRIAFQLEQRCKTVLSQYRSVNG